MERTVDRNVRDEKLKILDQTESGTSASPRAKDVVENPPTLASMVPESRAADPENAGAAREALMPLQAPPLSRTAARDTSGRLQAIEDFAARIADIHDGDFGDWMRRANSYWIQLVSGLDGAPGTLVPDLHTLHRIIQFNPNFEIEETRREVIALCQRMRKKLGASDALDARELGVSLFEGAEEDVVPSYSDRLLNPKPANLDGYGDSHQGGFIGKG